MLRELKKQLRETEEMIQGKGKIEESALEVLGCISYAVSNLHLAKTKEVPLVGWRFFQLIDELLYDATRVGLLMTADPNHAEIKSSFSRSVDMFLDFLKYNDPIILVNWGIDMDTEN